MGELNTSLKKRGGQILLRPPLSTFGQAPDTHSVFGQEALFGQSQLTLFRIVSIVEEGSVRLFYVVTTPASP
jgi:hypothetical protein